MSAVPRLWNGETAVCLASGPSLTADDVEFVRGRARAIVVNTTYLLAPWADVLYAADARWWRWKHDRVKRGVWPEFDGMKYSLSMGADRYGATVLRRGPKTGLSLDPKVLNTGMNSGYQSINLAVLLGAVRILLLGYDMQPGPKGEAHHHADHPSKTRSPFELFLPNFATLVEPLRAAGVEIVNCTRRSAIACFRRADLRDVLRAPRMETC